jgi:uncharacterized membrane protein
MTSYTIYVLALLIGVVAGLRTFIPLAAVSWAARLGALGLQGTWLAFLGSAAAPWILSGVALVELVAAQLPKTASRKTPGQFGARIASGAICGAAVGTASYSWPTGAIVGVVGAVLGTLAGSGARTRLARAFHRDRPAAFIEDAVAIVAAVLIVGVFG